MKKIKQIGKKSIKYMIAFTLLILVFIGGLTLTSMIPSSFLKEKMKESIDIFE